MAMQLLGSKVISDVLESLEFLSTAFEFEVRGSQEGVRKALALVWSREQQVKDAVVTAYVRLYLNREVRGYYSQFNPLATQGIKCRQVLKLPVGNAPQISMHLLQL